jgi:hypothetical protein
MSQSQGGPRSRRGGLLPVSLFALLLAAAFPGASAGNPATEQDAARSGPRAPTIAGGYIPARGAKLEPSVGTGNLIYYGGPVIASAKVVFIFWGPNFANAASPDYLYAQTLRSFRDQLGTTPEYNVITQYSGIQLANLGTGTGDLFDTSTPPTNVTESSVQSEVAFYLTFATFDASTIYEVVLPATSYYTSPDGLSCGGPVTAKVCARHSWIGSGASAIKYSVQPYPSCGGCRVGGWSDVQNQEHFVAHETRESVTDQQHNAWLDITGYEADDKCNWVPTPFIGTGGYAYQYEWSNASSSCVRTIPITASPIVTTTSASSISQSAATLGGTVNPRGASTSAYFEWGTTTGYGNTTYSQNVGAGTTSVPYSVNLSGLSCATTYHFQAVATNNGGTGYGGDQSFTTGACPTTAPTVTTSSASSISQSAATLGGTVNPNGASTNAYFQWGTTAGYGNTTYSQNVGAGTTSVPYSVNLSGLSCATTYHFRAVATNNGGTGYGGDQSFTTSACPTTAPTVTTSSASSISQSAATLAGTVNPNGASTNAYFQWGATTGYGNTTYSQNVGAGTTSVPYSVNLSGLSCVTTYHFRAVATSSGGTGYGGDQSFTTGACPTAGANFYTVTPCRLIDTRNGSPLTAGVTYEVGAAGFCGIAATATSISVNVTDVNATHGGFMTFWPAQGANPGTSTIDFTAGRVLANNAIFSLAPGIFGSPGAIWLTFTAGTGTADLLIDINGYFQ